jgi:hypothetical protein
MLVNHLHQEGIDRGMVATFGDTFRVEQDSTTARPEPNTALAAPVRSALNEGTRPHDSMRDIVAAFQLSGRRDCPKIRLIVADGIDSRSRDSPSDRPASHEMIGRFVGQRSNHEPTNFPFQSVVDRDQAINARALATIGHHGRFPAVTIAEFPLLKRLFLQSALRITTELQRDICRPGNVSWHELTAVRRLARRPIDDVLLIDRSGRWPTPGSSVRAAGIHALGRGNVPAFPDQHRPYPTPSPTPITGDHHEP